MHISRYESLSNVSAFLTSNSATWSLVTESPAIWGTTIVLSRISEYRSPIIVGLLWGGCTEYGLSSCGPLGGLGGGGTE